MLCSVEPEKSGEIYRFRRLALPSINARPDYVTARTSALEPTFLPENARF